MKTQIALLWTLLNSQQMRNPKHNAESDLSNCEISSFIQPRKLEVKKKKTMQLGMQKLKKCLGLQG